MATFNRLNGFAEHLAEKVHNLQSDTLKIALSNTAPTAEASPPTASTANCVLANVTQISYTNLGSRNVTVLTAAQTDGTYSLSCDDVVLAATGSVGPFRYIYLYNDTATNDNLIAYADYGSSVTLATSENFTIAFGDTVLSIG